MQLYGPEGNRQLVIDLLSDRITAYMQQHCLQTLVLLKGTDARYTGRPLVEITSGLPVYLAGYG